MSNPSSQYKIILFDLDGTLFNPIGVIHSVHYALEKLGLNPHDNDKLLKFIGPPLQDSLMKYYGVDEATAWKGVAYYREYLSTSGMYQYSLYPGIQELLQKLKESGKLLYVVTIKPNPFSENIIKHFGLRNYFEKIITQDLEGKVKTKEELIGQVIKFHPQEKKQSFIMVGDRDQDIIGARNNAIDVIGATYGYGSEEEIKNEKPTYIVNSVKDLEELFLS